MSILNEVDLGEEAEFSSPLQMTELFSKYREEIESQELDKKKRKREKVEVEDISDREVRFSYEDNIMKFNRMTDEEENLSVKKSSEITFLSAKNVSEYETQTRVEYKINTWEELNEQLDLTWLEQKDYHCVQSLSELKGYIKEMVKAEYIAVDTETTGLNIYDLSNDNPIKDRIVGMSLTWRKDQGIYIPFRHKKFKNLPLDVVLKAIKPILEKKKIIGFNLLFDYKVFYDIGIILNVFMDVMNLLFSINTMVAKGGKGLKYNISKIFGIDTLDLETMTGEGRYAAKFDTLDFKTCQAYGCADTDFTFILFVYLLPMLDKRQYVGLKQDMKLIPILSEMEYYGRKIDMELLPVYNEINDKDIFALMDLCFKYVGTALNLKEGKKEVARYLFNFNSADELTHVLYDLLGLEVLSVSEKTGKPKTNNTVIKTFLSMPAEEPDEVLNMIMDGEDVKSALWNYEMFYDENGELIDCEGDEYLIKWKKISVTKYPIIYLIKQLRGLIKLKTSFFIKLMNDNYEGKYFTPVSLTAAETYRIIDPIQTIPAYLKKIFIKYEENHTCMDCDYSQVEARVFTSLAQDTALIEKLNRPWADYHREGGAFIFGTKPEDITKEQRSNLKVVNFGLPFKMGPRGLVGFKYGIIADKEEEKRAIIEMTELSEKWKKANWRVQNMLDETRAEAVKICTEPGVKKFFGDRLIGKIYNAAGRARVFDLEGVVDREGNIIDKSKAEKIYRQAGNFPIQGYARHIFGEGLAGLWEDFVNDGLVRIKIPDESRPLGYRFINMIYLLATVHDELFLSIDDRINPMYIIDRLEGRMMAKIPGHANYYMGVSYCHNWHDGHSGAFEMSASCMLKLVEKNREIGYVPKFVAGSKLDGKDYVKALYDINYDNTLDDTVSELLSITELERGSVNIDIMIDKFSNYEIKGFCKSLSMCESFKERISEVKSRVELNSNQLDCMELFFKMYEVYINRVKEPIKKFKLIVKGTEFKEEVT